MGIVTEAVIANLQYALTNVNEAIDSIDNLEQSCHIGFRNPYNREAQSIRTDIAREQLKLLKIEIEKTLEEEKKY